MRRDLRSRSDTTFDVLVIGSGICGVATAYAAALRRLSVAAIDARASVMRRNDSSQ